MDQFMGAALEEARRGAAEGGIPIGAALVDGEHRLVATGRNRRVQDRAVVMHAEINCLFNAGKTVSDFRGMTMYSTLMPCHMCAGAVVQFGITKVVVGESENFPERNGLKLLQRHGVEVVDLDQGDAKDLLQEFIQRHPEVLAQSGPQKAWGLGWGAAPAPSFQQRNHQGRAVIGPPR